LRKFNQSGLIIVLIIFLLSCNQTIGTYDKNNDFIKDISIVMYESFPQQVNVIARGRFTNSCTKIDNIIETQSGNTLMLTITKTRETNKVCSPIKQIFEEVIPLNIAGLRAGIYNIKVNNLSDFFELDVDNLVQ
jgi:inhibitor of cysteine peptidase